MLSYDSTVSTEIEGLSFSFLSSRDIRSLSFSEVKNVGRMGHESAGKSCIYDPCLGSTEIYRLCGSCNEMSNCDGHLGHIEFAIPLYHPMMMKSLCKLLKTVCFYCGRIKFRDWKLSKYVALFEMCQTGMLSDTKYLDQMLQEFDSKSDKHGELFRECREEMISSILTKIENTQKEERREGGGQRKGEKDEEYNVWNEIRNRFFEEGAKLSKCSHCGSNAKFSIKANDSCSIELSWPQTYLKPNLIKSYREFLETDCDLYSEAEMNKSEPKSETKMLEVVNMVNSDISSSQMDMLNPTGKSVNKVELQSFHLIPYLSHLFANYAKLLSHLFPQSRVHKYKIFFMECMGVSANRFRPPLITANKQIVLHTRSSSLLDIVTSNEFIKLLLQFKYGNRKEVNGVKGGSDGGEGVNGTKRGRKENNLIEYLVKMNYQIDEKQLEQFESYLKDYNDLNEAIRDQIVVLQKKLFQYMDNGNPRPGLKQTLEHKTGTIRQNMIGKRVNYSARTVIAPDCFIDTNQMGMPLKFAMELTVPEYVTRFNVNFLRKMVINGPKVYPGAKLLRDTNGKVYNLSALSHNERVAKSKLLLVGLAEGNAPKVVYRHILDGDVVLMNRQPTLHKPGIMAHFVKVLTRQKIFRLNYVNCSTYNADFDGDEMNLHLPQDYLSQSEAQLIANADCQFVVPKNGQPIRGLIQDHCQGGALLTSRDTFFTKAEFCNLVYLAVNSFVSATSSIYLGRQDLHHIEEDVKLDVQLHQLAKRLKMLSDPFARRITNRSIQVYLDLPAILYPKQLYTGKQVVTCVFKTLIDNIALGLGDLEFEKKYRGINLTSKSKTPGDAWGGCYDGDKEESTIVIRNSELLQGVLDKSQFGASSYGLTHLIFELLGPRVCGMLLNSFSYLFTSYLQMRGATCSPRDFLLTESAEKERLKILRRIKYTGLHLQELFMALSRNTKKQNLTNGSSKHSEVNGREKRLLVELKDDLKVFCEQVKSQVNSVTSGDLDACRSFGEFGKLLFKVLTECIGHSTGGIMRERVNNYVHRLLESCCRVPKVKNAILKYFADLPEDSNLNMVQLCFPTWLSECSERVSSTNGNRNGASGLHNGNGKGEQGSLSSRSSEGDDSTKYKLGDAYTTCSRFYNMVCKSPRGNDILSTFDRFFQSNIVGVSSDINELVDSTVVKFPRNGFATMVATGAKGSKVNFAMISCALSQQTLEGKRVPVMPSVRTLPCFAFGDFGSRAGGFITDRFLTGLRPQEYFFHCMSGREGLVDTCVKTAKTGYLQRCVLKAMEDVIVCYDATVRDSNGNVIQFKYGEDGIDVSKSSYLSQLQDLQVNQLYYSTGRRSSGSAFSKTGSSHCGDGYNSRTQRTDTYEGKTSGDYDPDFERYFNKCKCEPGDAVGCIAGQSIGEPATQMTLNTFHLAGHGATNVTLGIPRLLEILHNTSSCSTPFFSAPIRGNSEKEIAANAENATNALRKIYLSDVVHSVGIESNVYVNANSEKEWEYEATIQFDDLEQFKSKIGDFETQDILKLCSNCLLKSFMKRVMGQMIVTMDVNVPFELQDKSDQLEEFWNMFVMQKQIVKRDKISNRIRKMVLASGSSTRVPQKHFEDHDKIINLNTEASEREMGVVEQEEKEDEFDQEEEYEGDYDDEDADVDEDDEEENDSSASYSSSATQEAELPELDTQDVEGTPHQGEEADLSVDIDAFEHEQDADDPVLEQKTPQLKFRKQNISSIDRKVFQFVKSLDFSEETSTLKLKFGWPFAKCPYYLDLYPILKEEISRQTLRDSPNIRQSRIVCHTVNDKDEFTLHCDGTNLTRLFMIREDIVDFNVVKLNDVATVLKYYGIEAARSCIVSELNKVFSVYGITVDYRHLTLLADFMTQQGDVRTFTRYGMAKHTSPLLQMSFESTMKFLMSASERGAYDNLKTPSGALMAGRPVHVGSSLCRLMQVVDFDGRQHQDLNMFNSNYEL
ncbi:DNA-directed RNA polymerase [Theileria orientalis strain Shintoku]|uniref:DNA-directed RNA polymerase subunit n=1 Tax=Theileria orientalis strain Shintoku TaxID=869250 RepID=J4C2U6_THEOR|nr:DNA-directed RNA polymerase [Theileria orientalis strain Shintoku]BAM39306.1 DNA-directed RNA polymerase [Theileria orientalis strain Shintoku]|eukprot:XP_009689607.1 DNA-directed RNA polymerase [Theileria orientalis strain Shintoku]